MKSVFFRLLMQLDVATGGAVTRAAHMANWPANFVPPTRKTVQGAIYGLPVSSEQRFSDGTTRRAPEFDPTFNIDSRFPDDRRKRPEDWQKIEIYDVRPYLNARDGSPRVAFNQGALHISQAQLSSAGIEYPQVLQGKFIMVDFFKPGDILLNGSQVTDPGRIVNQFTPELDLAVAQDIQKTLAIEKHKSWAGALMRRSGANNRPQGDGLSLNTRNDVQSTNSTPQMQGGANMSGSTGSAGQGQLANQNVSSSTGTEAGSGSNETAGNSNAGAGQGS